MPKALFEARFILGDLSWEVELRVKRRKASGERWTLELTAPLYDEDACLTYQTLKATNVEDAKLEARQVLLALAWDLEKKAKELDWK